MSLRKNEIGGYIELALPENIRHYHKGAIAVNSGRSALRYIIRAYSIKDIWVPYFTCHVIWDVLKDENCNLKFYHIDKDMMPKEDFETDAYIIYNNYYGVCSSNIQILTKKYKNIIIDNTQAFYMKPCGLASFYSPRKFFGVPDGGYVICDKKLSQPLTKGISFHRFSHLIKKIDLNSNEAYADFNKNDDSLKSEDLTGMSQLTARILSGIDYKNAKKSRIDNFLYLDKKLNHLNGKRFELGDNVPMYYPFYSSEPGLRKKLIDAKIYIPSCWRETEDCTNDPTELDIHKYLLPLIIDQRYTRYDMDKIVEVINGY